MDLPPKTEATELVEFGDGDRFFELQPAAAAAWTEMKKRAEQEDVELQLVSAFRGVKRQQEIVTAKRERGLSDEEIFRVNARPGFSEHHTGRAIDLSTSGYPPLEECFEESKAFAWLQRHAGEFGFSLSYPRNNPYGISYEPWHWCWQAETGQFPDLQPKQRS